MQCVQACVCAFKPVQKVLKTWCLELISAVDAVSLSALKCLFHESAECSSHCCAVLNGQTMLCAEAIACFLEA
eukprot:5210687-Lingulodinium_polyedra.AAC.1